MINYYDVIIKTINSFVYVNIIKYKKINSKNIQSIYDFSGGVISYAYFIREDISIEQKNFLYSKLSDFLNYRIEELENNDKYKSR